MSLYSELKRRNVIRVAIAYVAFAWLIIQVVETLFPVYGLTAAHIRIVVALLAIGFPLIVIFAWVYELTRPLLEGDWAIWRQSESGSAIGGDGMYEARFAEALVVMRREAGDEAGAQEVVEALIDNSRRLRDAGITMTSRNNSVDYHAGIAAYLSGDRDKGLAMIAKAVDDGFWIAPMAAFQEELFADPGFAAILEVNEAREARECARILDVVCNDNPYAEVWQPLPQTCEAHMQASAN